MPKSPLLLFPPKLFDGLSRHVRRRHFLHASQPPPQLSTSATATAAILQQTLSHLLASTTSGPLAAATLQAVVDLTLSSHGFHLLPLAFAQIRHLIDTDTCNCLIKSYIRSNGHRRSVLLFIAMLKASIFPDLFTFPPLIKSAAQLHLLDFGLSIHGCIAKVGCDSDVFVNTALVSMYCSFGHVGVAERVFDGMPHRNSVTWNAMITGYVNNRRFREAHVLFSRMIRSGAELGEVTMVCALTACSHLGALRQGIWIHNYIKNHGLTVNVFVGTALIDMFMKCGVVDEAVKVFRAMRVRNDFTWNALISGFAMNGGGEAALGVFNEMIAENIKPNGITFLAVLCACCHHGFVNQGRKFFISMEKDFGLQPRIEHYGCMVDLLGRAGVLKEAYGLIQTMPMKPDAAIWRALAAACRIHGDLELGELAIRKLLELEPCNGENYILLVNLLARDQRWTTIGKVRQMMRQRGIKKDPGCSSIEIDGVVHEFLVTDGFQRDGLGDIFAMLVKMKRELKLAGYRVDTDMVSYDLEEEEREMSVMHHSEKIALAFGLVRTQHGSDLRIVKNLRICVDCHTFFKFVSKVYQRNIVVRDNNRYHHFAGGICSCKDYW
ncbi:pentatricopeptide repeat-containing protein At2g02980, chloroplastic-like [Curcuma longa]|uniref:pentatricopeptide repeat-containing protein At2g02980, chloroplastic-like n=1 Tax=Curcuma longa TaxID=136217 RepID=UPI003D9E3DF0